MTDKTDQSAGGAPNTDVGDNGSGNDQDKKTVDYATYDKTVAQKKAHQKRADDVTKELEDAKAKLAVHDKAKADAVEEKAKADGNWDLLLQAEKDRREKAEQETVKVRAEKEQSDDVLDHAIKLNAVYERLPGKLKNAAYSQFIDVEKIAINPETGEIDSDTVKAVVDAFAKEHKDLLDTKNFKSLPGDSANGGVGSAIDTFNNSTGEDKKKNMAAAIQEYKRQNGIK